MQAIGSPVGAYMVQHLDPQRLQFAIATALLSLFLLMVLPVAKCIRQRRMRRAHSLRRGASLKHRGPLRKQGGSLQRPLLLPGQASTGRQRPQYWVALWLRTEHARIGIYNDESKYNGLSIRPHTQHLCVFTDNHGPW